MSLSSPVPHQPDLAAAAKLVRRILLFLATITFITLTMAWWFIQFITAHIRQYFQDVRPGMSIDTSPEALAEAERQRCQNFIYRQKTSLGRLGQTASTLAYRQEVEEARLIAALFPYPACGRTDHSLERRLMETVLEDSGGKGVVARRMLRDSLGPDDENEAIERRVLRKVLRDEIGPEELRQLEERLDDMDLEGLRQQEQMLKRETELLNERRSRLWYTEPKPRGR